jgi:DNA-binding PadR family transcriptional regulator
MYELLVLSLLMHWPLHAYLIVKISNNILGPEEHLSRGTLSTLLEKLEQDGLIADADPKHVPFPSDRPSRVLAITPSGRERFAQLMLDTTAHPGFYRRLFHIKALHLRLLPIEHQLYLVEHYLHYYQALIRNKQAEMQAFAADSDKREYMGDAFWEAAQEFMRFKVEQWQIELTWVQSLHERILSQLKMQAGAVSMPVIGKI